MPAFGFEVFMNQLLVDQRLRIKVVSWDGVTHVRKSEKLGLYDGVAADTAMVLQILRLQSPWDVILQNYFLLILSLSPTDPRRQIYDRFANSIRHAWIGT
jgi:hypothetical protein